MAINARGGLALLLITITVTSCIIYGLSMKLIGTPIILKDAYAYNMTAQRLLNTGTFEYSSSSPKSSSGPTAFTMPGYTLFLSAIYKIVPNSTNGPADALKVQPLIMTIQLLLAVASSTIIALCGYQVGGLQLGWSSGILAALYTPFGINSTVALTETLALFLAAVTILCAVQVLNGGERHPYKWMAAFGLAGGLSILVRPSIGLWLAITPIMWIFLNRANIKKAIIGALIAACGIAIVLAPWVARNALSLHEFIPLTSSASTPLLDSTGGAIFTPAEKDIMKFATKQGEDPIRAVAIERLKNYWAQSPDEFIKWKWDTLVKGTTNHTNLPVDIISDINTYGLPDASQYVDSGNFLPLSDSFYSSWFDLNSIYHKILLILALIGVLFRCRRNIVWLLATMPAYYAVLHTMILFMTRYFYPAMPAIILLAGWGCTCFYLAIAGNLSKKYYFKNLFNRADVSDAR